MEHIRPLLKRIIAERGKQFGSMAFGEIPDRGKLGFNRLSEASKFDIRRARSNVDVVGRFLDGQSNPSAVSVIQSAMRERYLQLVDLGYDPDDIFGKLCEYVRITATSEEVAASHVIVTYFFDSCDVFENVPVS